MSTTSSSTTATAKTTNNARTARAEDNFRRAFFSLLSAFRHNTALRRNPKETFGHHWGEYLRKQRRYLEYLSSPLELFSRAEFETLKRKWKQSRPFFPHLEHLSDWPKFVCQMEFTVTGLRMCHTALKMERHHRRTGMPHACPPDAPKDSLHGTTFELHSGRIRVRHRKREREFFREFSGRQLNSPGKKPFFPKGKYRKPAET